MSITLTLADLTPAQAASVIAALGGGTTVTHTVGDVSRTVTLSPVTQEPPSMQPATVAAAFAPQQPAGGPAAPLSSDVTGDTKPSVPASAPSDAGSTVDKDANGLPWDARIHASSKALNADGTWRTRRNLPDGERERVEAELRGQPAPAPAAPTPPAGRIMSKEEILNALTVAVAGKYIESIPAFLQQFGLTLTDVLSPNNAHRLPEIQAALEQFGDE